MQYREFQKTQYNAHETVLGNGKEQKNEEKKKERNNPPNHDFVQIKRQKVENEDDYVAVHYISRGFGLNAVEGMNKKNPHMLESNLEKSFGSSV